jgi:hypothetical protein
LFGAPPDPERPRIYVVTGNSKNPYIIVDQEPIVFPERGTYRITWRIVTRGYKFDPKDGIRIDPKPRLGVAGQVTGCKLVDDREFVCNNDSTKGKGIHSYTIKLLDSSGVEIKVDPYVVND